MSAWLALIPVALVLAGLVGAAMSYLEGVPLKRVAVGAALVCLVGAQAFAIGLGLLGLVLEVGEDPAGKALIVWCISTSVVVLGISWLWLWRLRR